jgi:hypothetical protein
VVYFGTLQTGWYILGLFRQGGIFWNSSDRVVYFGTLQTGWYILELFRQGGIFVFFYFMAYMLYIVDALERDLRPFAVLKLFAFPIN